MDYRNRKPREDEPPRIRLEGQKDRRWWTLEPEEAAASITATIDALQKAQAPRIRQAILAERDYGNLRIRGGGSGSAYERLLSARPNNNFVTFNLVQSIVDTMVSRIGEQKPRPYFLTDGGHYKAQRKAKLLNKFVEGIFYETKTYELGPEIFRDALVWGDGLAHVFIRGGRIHHERVMSSEWWVDEAEAQYGKPRQGHRVKAVDRDEVISWVESGEGTPAEKNKLKDAILRAPRVQTISSSGSDASDMVNVAESWKLGDEDGKGEFIGGWHCITLLGTPHMLLKPEPWKFGFFPIARMPYCRRLDGYWSQGIPEQSHGAQMEVNKALWLLQRSAHIAGTGKVFIKNGSSTQPLSNEVWETVNYQGEPPVLQVFPFASQELLQYPNDIIAREYQRHGVSELTARAAKPAGLNSGQAIRDFEDIESERHRTPQRAYDFFFMELAMMDVAMAREYGSQVRVPGRNSFEKMDFRKSIGKMSDEEFLMQVFPVSRLPKDPAGRLQTVTEYIRAGFITQRQGRRALDFPDLESIESLANAMEDMLTKIYDLIIDGGVYTAPEPTDDLDLSKQMGLEYLAQYRMCGLEDEKLNMLRDRNSQIDMLQQRAAMAMAPPPAPGVPQGVPQAAPVSQLLPQRAA